MKTGFRISSIILLLIDGVATLVGGIILLTDPTGNSLQLPNQWLQNIPLDNYFISGPILGIVIGVLNLATAVSVIARHHRSTSFIILQGYILIGWVLIQVFMIQTVHILHVLFGGIGFTLFCLGMMIVDDERIFW